MERFWAKVDKDGPDGCWLWTATRFRLGYGQTTIAGKTRSAHRVAYELVVGPIPEGLELDHLCRVRHCVNPAHLEPVTHAENMRRAYPEPPTACPQGHPYDLFNTYVNAKGRYVCRDCMRTARERWEVKHVREATGG